MMSPWIKHIDEHRPAWLMGAALTATLTYFFGFVDVYPYWEDYSLIKWISQSWNAETDFVHGWTVPFLVLAFVGVALPRMRTEPIKKDWRGLFGVVFGILLYVACMRTLQPRLAYVGLPFFLVGGVMYVWGWRVARHVVFASFFIWMAVPVPGFQQATNFLQLFVTKACFVSGQAVGMDIVQSGNDIYFTDSTKQNFNIAEGCSGIRSLMALVMISAIYAYYSQKELWKKVLLFSMALPLAMLGNYARVFTILILAEFGFGEFAAGAYHDWAGLLFFFPVALAGLFVMDRVLNWRKGKKKVRRRVVS